ncbi:hypothetical protein V5799_025537 [Amblyomma americanum]|uniref:Uncharacterized protein n=1 Tax=Amblyomma americanum TaxID=6943 RepID=A0AAQ4E996_AMBAM
MGTLPPASQWWHGCPCTVSRRFPAYTAPAPATSQVNTCGLISADGGGDEVPVDACVVEVASSSQGLPCVEDPLQPSSPTATATARLPPSGGVVAACDVAASSGLDLLGVEDPVEPSSPSSTTVSATSPSSRGDTAACGVVDSFDLDLPGEEDPIGPSSAPSATVSTTSSPSRSGMATCGVVPSSGLDFPGVEDPVRPSTSSSTASATSAPSSGGMAAYDADLHGEEGSCAPSYTIIFDTAATDVGDAEAAVEMLSTVEEESSSAEPLEKPKRILRVHNVPIVFELVDDGRAKNDSSSGCGSPPLVESRTPRNSCAFELSFGQKQSGPKSTHLASEDTLSGRGVHHDEIDALIRVLASVGRIADQVAPSSMDAVMASLEEDIRRPGCPMKVRQILSDVLELRATQWQLGSS